MNQNPERLVAVFALLCLSGASFVSGNSGAQSLLPGLLSTACVLLTLALGTLLRSFSLGIVAALILLFSRDFLLGSSNDLFVKATVFVVLLSFVVWKSGRYAWAGVVVGLGMWLRSMEVLLLFPAVFFHQLLSRRLFKSGWRFARRIGISFGVALVIGSSVLALTAADSIIAREISSAEGFVFLKVLRESLMPWSVLLVFAMGWGLKERRFRRESFLLPLIASALLIGKTSFIVTAYPFLALLAAQPLTVLVERHELKLYRVFIPFALVASVLFWMGIDLFRFS